MAKKTVASLHEGSKEGRAYTKVIKMVQDFFKKYAGCINSNPKNPLTDIH